MLAPLTILIIGTFFRQVSVSEVVLLIIGGLVFVSITRGRLLGASLHVHPGHFPELFAVVERVAAKLGVCMPQIFIRDDHTRLTSPLTASGRENPITSLIFGAWLRWTEYTADRVAPACTGSIEAALSAISVVRRRARGRG